MNTARSKKLKRYSNKFDGLIPKNPVGTYSPGLYNNNFAMRLGRLAAYWPHVEERMIDFLEHLLSDDPVPGRPIFRGIVSQQARITVMRALLENAERNKNRDAEYDAIIDEFASLNSARNTYLHGLWTTHESGRVFLTEANVDDWGLFNQREVKIKEIREVLKRMDKLWRAAYRASDPTVAEDYPDWTLLKKSPPPSGNPAS